MLGQHALDLGRRDVLAAANDRVVRSTLYEDEAGLVDITLVPGGKPACALGSAATFEVFAGHLRAAYYDPPHLPRRAGIALRITNLDLDAGQRSTNRTYARPDDGIVAVHGGAMVLRPEDGNRGRRFCQPVCIDESG